MELSQENRYVVRCFETNFIEQGKKKIILYGLGINTRAILETLEESGVVGLMDSTCEGENIFGLPVYTMEEARKLGTCVVIVARNSVVPIIFERIRELEEKWNFPVFNVQGERLIQKEKEKRFENNNPYWNKSEDKLLERIGKHEIISFDVFDTLIVRKCMLPVDVFDMVERELKKKGVKAGGFSLIRREAEVRIAGSYPKLQEIYEVIRQEMGWSVETCEMACELEMKIEKVMCVPRKAMCAIYHKAIKMGKRVILISDMYLAGDEMKALLEQCGIFGYERLFISCEEKAEKKDGKLYEKIRQAGYEGVLHIGDNEKADGEMAVKGNADAYTIMSPYEMLVQSSLSKILAYADSLEKRLLVGRMQVKLFNDPFCLGKEKGLAVVEQPHIIGYVFLAPIVSCFLFYLADEVKRRNLDKILFCARDGFVIWKLYESLTENRADLPEGVYFKTSRRAITVPSIQTEEDIRLILQKPYNTTMGNLLLNRFGIRHDEWDTDAKGMAVSTKNNNEVEQYILKYKDRIFANAEQEKETYLSYMEKNSILTGRQTGIYDFCSGGTIQHYFKRLTAKEVRGIYFATVNIPNTLYDNAEEISTLFGNIGQYEMKYHLAAHYMYLEAVLTDEHGTLIKYGLDESPVYDEAENERRSFKVIQEIQKGILSYFDELLEDRCWLNYENVKEFADKLLGCLFQPESCRVADELRNVVKAESSYDFLGAYRAWNKE